MISKSKLLGARVRATAFAAISLLAVVTAGAASQENPSVTLTRVAFGSCAKQDKPQEIWNAVNKIDPQVFVFLGDNIYGDSADMGVLRAKYDLLAAQPGFKAMRAGRTVLATWDDHDYGLNDGGADFTAREQSQKLFVDFWGDPADSPRRSRPGVYNAYTFGPPERRAQIIMLDTRYFRSPLILNSAGGGGVGRYKANDSADAVMLGEAQWKWLEGELRKPARVRLIGSSVQFNAEFHGFEAWANFPRERRRMMDLIRTTRANGVIFLSGDVHFSQISKMEAEGQYPIYDFTSSGLTHNVPVALKDIHRVGRSYNKQNFGSITIDWDQADPVVHLRTIGLEAEPVLTHDIKLSEITFPAEGKPSE